ncbi:MAG: hypothetical protein AUJ49_10825 [Desulfovibrionaceae bacterium CG1_02_65_16]|nr:MAG: hypothetical protein AUJ49_10825 [Desulfovibrionaceae bacterium CG1_02_65_16]
MLLPESDAKFKYCPLLKTKDDKLKFCLGSMCMLWRWANPTAGAAGAAGAAGTEGDDAKGYCGAGGVIAAAAVMHAPEVDSKPVEDY